MSLKTTSTPAIPASMAEYASQPDKYYVKHGVSEHEYKMQTYVRNLNIVRVPEVSAYCHETKFMAMPRVGPMSVSDMYGESAEDLPKEVFDSIVDIVQLLVANDIEFPDLTGYNFVEDLSSPGKVWIIDFEHATLNDNITDEAILALMNGERKWNPEFA